MARYWFRVGISPQYDSVEAYSHDQEIPGAEEITKEQYDSFIAALPIPPSEKSLESRIKAIEDKLGIKQ